MILKTQSFSFQILFIKGLLTILHIVILKKLINFSTYKHIVKNHIKILIISYNYINKNVNKLLKLKIYQ